MSSGNGEQLGLFGAGAGQRHAPEPVADPEMVALAERLPPGLRFGTCSWTFEGWKGAVYRRHYGSKKSFMANSLAEYVHYPLFRSVEIDRTYYAPLSAAEWAAYADVLPSDFDAGIKVWQDLTTMVFPNHPRFAERAGQVNPGFLDPDAFNEFFAMPLVEAFVDHCGPILLSLPPAGAGLDPAAFEQRLAHFLARAPSGFRYAVELRDRRLLTRRYLSLLRDFGASHVFNYWSRMPSIAEQKDLGALTGPFVVARLMLPPGAKYAQLKDAWAPFDRLVDPQPQMRQEVVDLIREACELGYPIYVFVNNKAEGSAPLTIRALAEALV